jgi:hypothetical protein
VLAGGFAVRSRAAWVSVPRHDDRGGRCSLDWDRRRRVTPVQTASQEAWPEADLGDGIIPRDESRGGTPSSVRAPKGRAPHRKMRRLLPGVCRRSASFIYLFLGNLNWRNGLNGRTKARPTPALSLDRTGFAIDVTIFLQACDPFAIVRTIERGRKNAPRDGRVWP